ncbi:MAG TPA: hypothetical protein VI932_09820 [Bacteroidota bacterium]|nr:hypothetical protein [Bacteroidota bacterium]
MLGLSLSLPLRAQPDSLTADVPAAPIEDPARNRLLWMSTGRVMPAGTFSVGVFELVIIQGGYGIADVAQINATGTIGYWSIGSKFQILPPFGLFQGLAFGADAGFTRESDRFLLPRGGLYALNLSASAGNEDVTVHLNAMRVYPSEHRDRPTTYLQAGCSVPLHRTPSEMTTLLGEIWMVEYRYPSAHFDPAIIPAGIRHSTGKFTFEIAVMIRPAIFTDGRSANPIIPLPYLGFQWFI